MIRTSVDGFTTFDLKTNGDLIVNGIKTKSGGLAVSTGGIQVHSGGLLVNGGITLQSGQLNLQHNQLLLSNLILENNKSVDNVLSIINHNPHFYGSLFSIKDKVETKDSKYLIFDINKLDKNIFKLDSDGNIKTTGSYTGNNIYSQNHLNVGGSISFSSTQILADDNIILPVDKIYIEIINDHKLSENKVTLPTKYSNNNDINNNKPLLSGQILIIRNLDETSLHLISTNLHDKTVKTLKLLPQTTLMLVFNGHEWIDIQSIATSIDKLQNINEFTINNDIHMGNHSITTGGYRMIGLNKGEILVGSIGGAIKGRKGLTYSNGILSTIGLKVETLESDLNGNKKTIS